MLIGINVDAPGADITQIKCCCGATQPGGLHFCRPPVDNPLIGYHALFRGRLNFGECGGPR